MKKILFSFLIVVLFAAVFYYFFYQKKQSRFLEGEIYNEFTGEWEDVKINSNGIDRSKIVKADNNDGLHNYSILKGYFEKYDEKTETLTLKAAIAFTQNNLFETTKVKLSKKQTVYCVPENYTDPNTGVSYPMRKLTIPVKDNANLYVFREKAITFDQFLEQSNDLTLLLIQLTEDFDKNKTNYVKKIIITGLCE